ncbi:MAG: sigma-54-dependent Fis family transcriptional regulator [Deltaproteobacteria bacterium]|jgi:DNA-binding NtrC family response regulator|nr:sigma-54-dependent Fis family transcriptional regulator [Deltaproteobacteria bacterium]MBW2533926.1 sigma-54-dependent Fis family transcriptional regulator [Deltaproteobacteria bacterium]
MTDPRDRTDERLHEAEDIEALEQRIMELALERTGAPNGAIFLWDREARGLAVHFHVVAGVIVTLPGAMIRRRADGQPRGIAMWCFDHNAPYLCRDASQDDNYTRYFLDVSSIAAVPIPYQDRAIGVISVSSQQLDAFDDASIEALRALADASAKFLRRAQLSRASREDPGRPFLIKGLSPQWLEVERQIERVSATDTPVLIHGESGTGKDLVARAIRFNSRRTDGPYVTVNCAAIPETMLESILFGHVRGAFTGATFDKVGEFQKANGGTLFLDEVGELPMTLQPKVLRAVEQGEVQPLGSNKPSERVDVRLICATNRDLARMVREGQFRDDLYYRLGVMTLRVPPLREYRDNLEVLAHALLHLGAERHGKHAPDISPAAMARLQSYDFPGNVRELKNAMEHGLIMSTGDSIGPEDLPQPIRSAAEQGAEPAVQTPKTLKDLREQWLAPLERRYLSELLSACDGNVREAARRAGVNTVTMYRLLRKRQLRLARRVETAS